MFSQSKRISTLLWVVASVLIPNVSRAAILTESWETPEIASGATSTLLPAPWVRFSGSAADSVIFHPNSTFFNVVDPLAGPADGNQVLALSFTNTGIYRLSGALIQADTIYTLEAAIGNDLLSNFRNDTWSLQLWANTNVDGVFGSGDTFIGQQFGTSGTAVNPTAGNWALNSYSFNSAATPSLIGKELIVFLNNFDVHPEVGTSYYDNVRLSAVPATVPEPASLAIWGGISIAGLVVGWRRKRSRPAASKLDIRSLPILPLILQGHSR